MSRSADCRRSGGTRVGFSDDIAGKKNAPAPNITATSTLSSNSDEWSVANITAMPDTAADRTTSDATMMRWGDSRSAQTPPNRVHTRRPTMPTAMTVPSSLAEPPVVTMATASATGWNVLPSQDKPWPHASSRKSRGVAETSWTMQSR